MKRSLACALLGVASFLPLSGCATMFFPERQMANHSGKLDPNIVILNGVGLLFFLVPGIFAFGVDFATGAIYLPDGVEKGEGPFFRDDEVQVTVDADSEE